ncbi:MAG: hypothetical protein AB7O24_09980 [Kofleriaceae bacterium]
MRRARAALAALPAIVATVASADTPRNTPAAIEIDRDSGPAGRGELGFDSGAPVVGWAVSIAASWFERAITLRGPGGSSDPVRRRQTVALAGALALGPSVVVDARFPLSHQVGDRLAITGDARPLDRWVPGDLHVGARIRLFQLPHASAFVRGELSFPTGDDRNFAGEPSWTGTWNLIGRLQLPYGIVAAATAGIRLRGAEVLIADRVVGNELLGAAGFAIPVPPIRPLWCVADQVKVTGEVVGVLGDDVGERRGPSPIEARAGIVTLPWPSLAVAVRVGAGLRDQIGAPAWRAMVELTYRGSWQLMAASPHEPPGQELGDPELEESGD